MENRTSTRKQSEDFLSFNDLWRLCRSHLHWFVVSLIICLGYAFYYLSVTPEVFTRQAAILVKQEALGKSTGNNSGEEFKDLGMVQQTTNVTNVQRQLKSLEVLTEVVRSIDKPNNERNVLKKAQSLQNWLNIKLDDEKSTIINLTYSAHDPIYAEKVLSTVIRVYDEKCIRDKNEMTRNTSNFIQERLTLIERDLGDVDDSISTFKARNKITDLSRVSDLYLQQQSASDAQILTLTNQRSMATYILGILRDKESQHQLLPTNSGINNAVAEAQITQYNTQLLQLKSNMYHTSSQNPLIMKQEAELTEVRDNIIATINNQIKGIDIQLQSLQSVSGEADSKITQNPKQEKYLLSIERDQKVKESLYLYLLQKKEENEISITYTSSNIEMIDMPHGSDLPTSPNQRNILVAAILLGLLVPVIILFVRESLNTSVRDKHDIERKTTLSLIGEIPLINRKKESLFARIRDWGHNEDFDPVVVGADKQNYVNEAFRIVRSNMEFMTSKQSGKNVYIITSSYEGSGKTFVSMNLALALAIKGHKVLLIDGDLRHASASHHLNCPKVGLADYLSDKETDLDRILVEHAEYPTLHILPVGTNPPNPTELLSSGRFSTLIEDLRPHYDFILIDCPPAETLADTSIIENFADRTLFVIRAGLFERKNIYNLEADVQSGKYKNMSLILNGTKIVRRFGTLYGYGYGYHYGYGYSYSYRHDQDKKEKRKWISHIKSLIFVAVCAMVCIGGYWGIKSYLTKRINEAIRTAEKAKAPNTAQPDTTITAPFSATDTVATDSGKIATAVEPVAEPEPETNSTPAPKAEPTPKASSSQVAPATKAATPATPKAAPATQKAAPATPPATKPAPATAPKTAPAVAKPATPTAPKTAPVSPAVASADTPYYTIVLCGFEKQETAQRIAQEYTKKGLKDCRIIPENKYTRVVYSRFKSRDEAKAKLETLRPSDPIFKDAWVSKID